jgi:acetyl-CoA C-acetyltransferase
MERLNVISRHLGNSREVCIVAAGRSPVKRAFGEFKELSAVELGSETLRSLLKKYSIDGRKIEEFYLGCVQTANLGQSPAKQIAVMGGLADGVNCMSVNKLCSSGLKAIMLGSLSIMSGNSDCVLAGGVESMSNYPYNVSIRNGIQTKVKDSLNWDILPDAVTNEFPTQIANDLSYNMGFSRSELDEYASLSCKRALSAQSSFKFKTEILPVKNSKTNKNILQDSIRAPDHIKSLKPLKRNGAITAGNSCQINDGASFVILSTRQKALQENWKVLATVVSFADTEQESKKFIISPTLAIQKALNRASLSIDKIDFMEINEPFSTAVLGNSKLLGYPIKKINIYGGALSLGHPVGSSGCRIVVTLMSILDQENGNLGVASTCNGAGGASAIIIKKEQN